MDLRHLLRRGLREKPTAPAVSAPQGQLRYGELDDVAARLANALLGLGLQAGDRVAVLLRNRLEYPVVDVALAYAGLVRVALNVRLDRDTFAYILEDSDARVVISEASFDDVVSELAATARVSWVRLDDETDLPPGAIGYRHALERARPEPLPVADRSGELAWISYTSGTTGKPKGVMLTHRALVRVAVNLMVELGASTTAGSVLLVQPLSHGAGYFALAYLACGGHLHVRHGFDPEETAALGRDGGIETLKLVPTMLMDLLRVPGGLGYANIVYGAAPVAQDVLGQALERYGPVLAQLYGQSEAPMTITWLPKSDHQVEQPRARSVGRPWRGVQVEVCDPEGRSVPVGELGEVVVAGDHLMSGYLGRPDLTAEVLRDGRLWTRDMGVLDDRGYLFLQGRRDEMINSGGFNVSPREVEDVAGRCPGVREVAAVGVPHPRWGEAVRIFVAPEPGASLNQEDIIDFCRPTLGFRRPRSVVVLAALPRTSYGKLDRVRLLDPLPDPKGQETP